MSVETIYLVMVNGNPVYSSRRKSAAEEEAKLQGGIVTPVYLHS
ncbi:hypothetical protein ABC502_07740 [Alkalimonas sp. NCh-2]